MVIIHNVDLNGGQSSPRSSDYNVKYVITTLKSPEAPEANNNKIETFSKVKEFKISFIKLRQTYIVINITNCLKHFDLTLLYQFFAYRNTGPNTSYIPFF